MNGFNQGPMKDWTMGRKLAAVLMALIMFAAAQVQALGLGDIILESALNQPLTARIELLQLDGLRAEDIRIGIASASDFERFSIDRPFFLESIFFHLETVQDRTFVVLSTVEAVREPYLNFVLETRWPSGRLLNEYTLLLDLPVFSSAPVAQSAQAPVRSLANDLQAQSGQLIQNQSVTPTSSDSLSGQIERLGTDIDQNSGSNGQADRQAQLAADQTVTVDSSDTLWDIALQVRPDREVSVQQTMLAIQRLNENAFIGNNINMIRSGQVLRVPDAQQIRALSQQQAMTEVSRQNLLFADRRNTPLSAEPLTPPPLASNEPVNNGLGELSVVSGAADDADAGSQAARLTSLENRVAVNNEELDRVRLQNSELNERLSMLEQQIASAHEIIRLRDLELGRLPQALAAQTLSRDQAVEPVAAPPTTEPPPVITMAQEESGIGAVVNALVRNTYALIGGLLLVIFLLAMLLRRHRTKSDEFPDLAAGDDENEINTRSMPGFENPAYSNRKTDPVFTDSLNDFDDTSPEESAVIDDAQADVDLLDEVDTLLAYDRNSAARTLLKNAIAAEPERNDLRLKLLEVCVADGDTAGFQIEEACLTARADKNELTRIEVLRSQLPEDLKNFPASDSDNFFEFNELQTDQEFRIDAELSPDELTADPVDANDIGAESPADEAEEEFSFDLSDLDAPLAAGKQDLEESEKYVLDDQQAVTNAEDEIESIDFDFSLDDLDDLSGKAAGTVDTNTAESEPEPELEIEIERLEFTDDSQSEAMGLDTDMFAGSFEADAEAVEGAGTEPEISEKTEQSAFEGLDSLEFAADEDADADDFDRKDLRFLSDSDEAATKLDLARAYIDMGDTEGAQEILQEVLQEGTAEQIKDARSLLERVL